MTDAGFLKPRLRLENAAVARGGRVLLAGLTAKFDAGSVTHLSGANGIGKSTLLRAAAGMTPFSAGRCQLQLGDKALEAADMIHLLDDRTAFKPADTLEAAIRFLLSVTSIMPVTDSAFYAAADRFDISYELTLPVRFLSSGQRRRGQLLYMWLAGKPVWLLDEPFSALDTGGQETARQAIADHSDRGGIVLIAHHGVVSGADIVDLSTYQPTPDEGDSALW